MPKLKREIFMRPTRFVHRFGENDDPLMPTEYFDAPDPSGIKSVNNNGKGGFTGKQKGLHVDTKPFSPVDKFKGGCASLGGPKLDKPDAVADVIPPSTKERRTSGPLAEARKRSK